jgi:hypothetical protein
MLHRGRRNLGKRARRQEIEETRARNALGRLLIWTDLYPCQPISTRFWHRGGGSGAPDQASLFIKTKAAERRSAAWRDRRTPRILILTARPQYEARASISRLRGSNPKRN